MLSQHRKAIRVVGVSGCCCSCERKFGLCAGDFPRILMCSTFTVHFKVPSHSRVGHPATHARLQAPLAESHPWAARELLSQGMNDNTAWALVQHPW